MSVFLFVLLVVCVGVLFHQEAQFGFASLSGEDDVALSPEIDLSTSLESTLERNSDKSSTISKKEVLASKSSPITKPSNVEIPSSDSLFNSIGFPQLESLSEAVHSNGAYMISDEAYKVFLTLEPNLQDKAKQLLKRYDFPWAALVAIEVKTGRVLAIADYAQAGHSPKGIATKSGFPAASLFKLVTASAAIESKGMELDENIFFRGGTYTLNKYNYIPNKRRDSRKISLASALGKSCNPAFGRLGLQTLGSGLLEDYASNFGFNSSIPFELPVDLSTFSVDSGEDFDIARTAAGFGDAYISPLHASLLVGAIANNGSMMRPYVVDRVEHRDNGLVYKGEKQVLREVLLPSTANKLLEGMVSTVDKGTARKQFRRFRKAIKNAPKVAAKTGTLSGKNPKGRYHWFVAAAPADNPEIALASLVIDPGYACMNGTALGRLFMQHYFNKHPVL